LLKNSRARLRFLREAQTVAQLDHPNICTVYEVDAVEGRTFIAMAYVEGQCLSEKIEAGPLKIGEAINIGLQAARGLDAAHKKKIIHRDVKDGNIMINADRVVKILDFGLSKPLEREDITKPRAILGTVPFMSPEQATGKPVDYGTDIWSLGVVMYRMLTGEHPFKGRNISEMVRSIMKDEPVSIRNWRKDVPESLESCIRKMMEKNSADRQESMAEVISDLRCVKPN
jgi:serine/threonine-protein kinase